MTLLSSLRIISLLIISGIAGVSRADSTTPPAQSATTFADVAKLFATHFVPSLVLLHMREDAIDGARLVARPDAAPIVRVDPANPLRPAVMFDFAILRRPWIRVGSAVVVRPTEDDWVLGVGIDAAFPIHENVWLRVGAGGAAYRFQRLAPGATAGAPLETSELAPGTEHATGWAPCFFVGIGATFDGR